ncbi:MAG: TraR/DksA C4-type zinc finger protein [Candidatus Shapirobacteria bacterium]|jgi:RNA polymerase-binding transcription factor DksA
MISFPSKITRKIKEFLEKRLLELKRNERKLKADDPFFVPGRTEENSTEDEVDEQVGHFETEIKMRFVKKEIVEMRKALSRLKIGKYGICAKCGKMIDTDRLTVKPEATICVDCEKEDEK